MSDELVPNSFTTYKLEVRDALEGSIYSGVQLQVLHNLRSSYAEEKIALDYDPEHPTHFAQQEAGLKAQIQLITYLIDTSEASLAALVDSVSETNDTLIGE